MIQYLIITTFIGCNNPPLTQRYDDYGKAQEAYQHEVERPTPDECTDKTVEFKEEDVQEALRQQYVKDFSSEAELSK